MIRRIALAAVAAALLFAPPAAAQKLVKQQSIATIGAPALMDTTGMFRDRYAKVGDDMFIGGQPTEKALREMKAQGVTTVINLRTPPEMAQIGFDEAKTIADLGMKYVYIPMRGTGEFPYSPAELKKFTDAMASADGKVLLHCTIAWRASHLWGAYLIQQGVPVEQALAHVRAINLMDDHRMGPDARQPIEMFLGKPVPGLGHPTTP
jgi:uncharacterized protein (TIGR01244 family)